MFDATQALQAMRDVALVAQGRYDAADLFARVCEQLGRSLGFERVATLRYVSEERRVEPLVGHGFSDDALAALARPVADWPLLERALASGRLVFAPHAGEGAALPPRVAEELGATSMLAVPLVSSGRCLGFLVGDRGGACFALDDGVRDALVPLAVLAATLLERALSREEMQRLEAVRSQFIALASHELRTPVTVLHGIAATLHVRGDDLRPEQLRDLCATLYAQTERLRTLVEQLLDLSRLEAGAIRVHPEPLRIRHRIEELVLVLAAKRAQEVVIAIEPDVEETVDPLVFDRVVSNLITNALRYGAAPITIDAEQRDRHFRVGVEDRGRGVDPEFAPRLFERFTRSEAAASGVQGSGLGLSIARSYAHAHGGEIFYSPAKPTGARFELVLPRGPTAV